jgi:hypothetical protein
MDAVLGRYDTSVSDVAVIINDNHGFTDSILRRDVEPRVLPQAYCVAKADPYCPPSVQLTSEVKRYIPPFGRKRIGEANPNAKQFGESFWYKFQWISKPRAIFQMMHVITP